MNGKSKPMFTQGLNRSAQECIQYIDVGAKRLPGFPLGFAEFTRFGQQHRPFKEKVRKARIIGKALANQRV